MKEKKRMNWEYILFIESLILIRQILVFAAPHRCRATMFFLQTSFVWPPEKSPRYHN